MENSPKLFPIIGILMIFFLFACDPPPCENFNFEVQAVELFPRKVDKPTADHAPWRNEDQLSTSSLRLKLVMFKPILAGGGVAMSDECRPEFINSNPALGLTISSNKDYNSQFPAGSNLMPNISFSLFDDRKISEKVFLETQFNVSDWTYYYLDFKNKPSKSDMHSLVLTVRLMDGSELKSSIIDVLLRP